MSDELSFQSRVVAPKLRRLGDHPWAWVALGDLTEIFNQSATSIWWHYCNDARSAALAQDWDGKPWKFALPHDGVHTVTNVWDMKTGDLSQVPDGALAEVLVPAGWSQAKSKVADQLEKAIRQLFAFINESWQSARDVHHRVCPMAVQQWLPELSHIVQSAENHANLALILSQIESAPGSLAIRRQDDDEKSSIKLVFTDPKRKRCYGLSIHMDIRMVLGSLKLLDLNAYVEGMF